MNYCIERSPSGSALEPEQVAARVAAAAAGTGGMIRQREPGGLAWDYQNARTRVAFTLRLAGDQVQICLPLPRARFHLLEAQAVLAAIVGEEAGRPSSPGSGTLDDWEETNRKALAGLGPAAGDYTYLPPDRGEAWWRYLSGRQALRLAWPSADVVLPELLLIQSREGGPAARLLVWPEDASALVLPRAEFIAIKRTLRSPMPGAPPRPSGLIPWETAMAVLAEVVTPQQNPLPHWLYRGGDAHPFRMRTLLARAEEAGGAFRPVSADRVVDLPVPAAAGGGAGTTS